MNIDIPVPNNNPLCDFGGVQFKKNPLFDPQAVEQKASEKSTQIVLNQPLEPKTPQESIQGPTTPKTSMQETVETSAAKRTGKIIRGVLEVGLGTLGIIGSTAAMASTPVTGIGLAVGIAGVAGSGLMMYDGAKRIASGITGRDVHGPGEFFKFLEQMPR